MLLCSVGAYSAPWPAVPWWQCHGWVAKRDTCNGLAHHPTITAAALHKLPSWVAPCCRHFHLSFRRGWCSLERITINVMTFSPDARLPEIQHYHIAAFLVINLCCG